MKRPAVFIDRDGTISEEVGYVNHPSRFRLFPYSSEAIRILNNNGWLAIVITNQAGVARGYFTLEDLDAVGRHLEKVVTELGATWGGFYACPHLPEPEGINEYAIDCDCRKPAPGLIREALGVLDIDPGDAWFIGDTWMDMAAGRAAAKGEGPSRPLNPEWDARILDLLARGNLGAFDGFRDEEIRGDGGSGGAEIRAWQAAFAALASAGRYEAELLFYRPIPEWIVGMGVMHAHLS